MKKVEKKNEKKNEKFSQGRIVDHLSLISVATGGIFDDVLLVSPSLSPLFCLDFAFRLTKSSLRAGVSFTFLFSFSLFLL